MTTYISVIIPVYNVEPYIEECIQSVMNQTLTEGIECIIVDDCGQDQSVSIAQKMISQYTGLIEFSIIHHKHNLGLSGARNTGIFHAKGDYLYFLDSDDTIIPECLELMYSCTQKFPNAELIQAGGKTDKLRFDWLDLENKNLPDYSIDPMWICKTYLMGKTLPTTAWNRLIKKSFLLDQQLFFENGIFNEDVLWTHRLACTLSFLAILKKNVYYYRQREESIMSDTDRIQKNWILLAKKVIEYYKFIDVRYHHLEFCYLSNIAFKKISSDYHKCPEYQDKIVEILHELADLSPIKKRVVLYIYCYSPRILQKRFHYISIIKKILGVYNY